MRKILNLVIIECYKRKVNKIGFRECTQKINACILWYCHDLETFHSSSGKEIMVKRFNESNILCKDSLFLLPNVPKYF